jgi:PhnB protein
MTADDNGVHRLSAHIVVRDAAAATDWYRTALLAEERRRIAVPGGKLMEVELRFGESVVMLADEFPEIGVLSPLAFGGTAVVLHLETDDVDGLWRRAIAAGADIRQPLADQFWGERYGQIVDPFGHRWGLAQRIRDVPEDEVAAAAWAAFGGDESDRR